MVKKPDIAKEFGMQKKSSQLSIDSRSKQMTKNECSEKTGE